MIDGTDAVVRVKLWDGAIRVVHWCFVLLLPALWWTQRQGNIALHEKLGYVALGLVVFRLFWGVAGSSTAQFHRFVRGPIGVFGYVRSLFSNSAEPVVGHNPLGGWSVLALLGLLGAQVVLGLFTQDTDGIESGPLARYVEYDTADWARGWHGTLFYVLLAFVAIHVGAILFYLFVKRENLVGPMVTGHRHMPATAAAPIIAPWWRLAIGVALGVGVAWWVSLSCPLP